MDYPGFPTSLCPLFAAFSAVSVPASLAIPASSAFCAQA
jgi:hypothetical protein